LRILKNISPRPELNFSVVEVLERADAGAADGEDALWAVQLKLICGEMMKMSVKAKCLGRIHLVPHK
jgi:hypothetical protein